MSDDVSDRAVTTQPYAGVANNLINRVSRFIGGILQPRQMRRVARAKADVAMIEAQSQIQISDLHRRALQRVLDEEGRRQQNMEEITEQAVPELAEGAKPEDIDDDWMANFFEKCRGASDVQMQKLWAKVLAGEANEPGAFSRRSVNILAELDKTDAEMFGKLCGFVIEGLAEPIVLDFRHKIYAGNGVGVHALIQLESLGLIQFSAVAAFRRTGLSKFLFGQYQRRGIILKFPKNSENEIGLGHVVFTRSGRQLASLCKSDGVKGFVEFLIKGEWARYNPIVGSEDGSISIADPEVMDYMRDARNRLRSLGHDDSLSFLDRFEK